MALLCLNAANGIPYFGTRSKVVDFSAESALLTADGKALCEIRKGKNPLYQRFKRDVKFSFITEYFITAKKVCQGVLCINTHTHTVLFHRFNKLLTADVVLCKACNFLISLKKGHAQGGNVS